MCYILEENFENNTVITYYWGILCYFNIFYCFYMMILPQEVCDGVSDMKISWCWFLWWLYQILLATNFESVSVWFSWEQGRVLSEMPALADRNSILMRDTRLENAIICQPQQRNMHGRIFGGFLMRRAFEIAFSTCYVFGGSRPRFLEVDHVDFRRPVGIPFLKT